MRNGPTSAGQPLEWREIVTLVRMFPEPEDLLCRTDSTNHCRFQGNYDLVPAVRADVLRRPGRDDEAAACSREALTYRSSERSPVLSFDDQTSARIEVDVRGPAAERSFGRPSKVRRRVKRW
jgi:hypothetical protein